MDVCPSRGCDGHLVPCDPVAEMADNHYRRIFARPPVGLRVEEHTAQLDSTKGREYQEAFRSGDINLLSCSTTFELGVDVGELQAVVLNNVPPTVANYRQRAGRAGRRAGGAAFILTFAAERPHDQVFFADPPAIIAGEVRIPRLALENVLIARRHLNAVLMGDLLRYLARSNAKGFMSVGAFFDRRYPGGCYVDQLDNWQQVRRGEISEELLSFRRYYDAHEEPDQTIDRFVQLLQEHEEYVAQTLDEYQAEIEQWAKDAMNPYAEKREEAAQLRDRFLALAQRLRDESLIDYLSSAGILPSYSFPIHVVRLRLPPYDKRSRELHLERDLRQAIVEYAPGADVVADKRIWHSGGIEIRKTPRDWFYRICSRCNHLEKRDAPGLPLVSDECPVCGQVPPKQGYSGYRYIKPDGFQTDWARSGKPAGQHTERPENRSRAVLWSRGEGPEETIGNVVHYAYRRHGELLAVNSGPNPDGFRLCWTCGAQVPRNKTDHRTPYGKPCSDPKVKAVHLGHSFQTDTLHLRFASAPNLVVPSPEDTNFWLSLMYALLQGASRSLQIERRDLDAVLAPYKPATEVGWQQEIVLFDNVPGGAGHVRRIADNFEEVLNEALLVANCPDCAPETSCYHCLRDYGNQVYHDRLQRGRVAQFIESLSSQLSPSRLAGLPEGAVKVVAANRGRWLSQHMSSATNSVWLAVRSVSAGSPPGECRGWLDILQDLLLRGRQVRLWLESLPTAVTVDGLGLRDHLHLLVEKYGLDMSLVEQMPTWHLVVDQEDPARCRAVRLVEDATLDGTTGNQDMVTTTRPQEVRGAADALRQLVGRPLKSSELEPPGNVTVLHIEEGQRIDLRELLGQWFQLPLAGLDINDRFLQDARHINCLRQYLRLIVPDSQPVQVNVRTLLARSTDTDGVDDKTQATLMDGLNREFPSLKVRSDIRQRRDEVEHDRYMVLRRSRGDNVRIMIGAGLDFIRDGRARATTIVVEDPLRRA